MDVGIRRKGAQRPPEIVHADLLLLAIVLAEDCFGLIDANAINVAGVVNIDLVWQALLLVEAVYLYGKSRCVPGTKTSLLQGVLFSCLIVMCFVAAWRCQLLTGQPFVRGILPQRGFIVCIIAAILLRRPFMAGMVDGRRLIRGLIVLGTVASILYLIQVVLGSAVTFIHANADEKYGGLRLRVNGGLSTVSGILGLWLCLRDDDWHYSVPTLLALGVTLFVSKGRLELVTLLLVFVFLYVTTKGTTSTKVLLLCFGGLALILFSQTDYFGQVATSFLNGQVGGTEDTSTIRQAGRDWYDIVLASTGSELIGCGYPSSLYLPAIVMAGFDYNYLLVDNGLFGFRYVYGDLGVVLILASLASVLHVSYKATQGHLNSVLWAFFLFLALPFVNLAWWWNTSDWQVLTAIFVALGYLAQGTWCFRVRGEQHE